MLQEIILVLSIVFQLLAAFLALSLIRLTNRKAAWILVSVALLLMTVRRIISLVLAGSLQQLSADIFDFIGLVISVFLLAALLYMRKYWHDIFIAERVLRESEQRYRTLAQNIPDGAVFLFDLSCRYTLAEGPLLSQQGFSKEQFEGKTLKEVSLPEGWAEIFILLHESALNGNAASAQEVYNQRTYSIQTAPIRNTKNEVTGGMAVVLDITMRVKAENERAQAYETLQRTIDGVSEPIMVIGLDYQVNLMNRVVRERYAGHPDANPPMCYALSHHRDTPCNDPSHPCPLMRVRETLLPVSVVHEHQAADGEIRHVEIMASPLLDENSQLQGVIEAAHDITVRVRAEAALRESEEKFRNLFDSSEVGMFRSRLDGSEFLDFNEKFLKILGYTFEELKGKPSVAMWADKSERDRMVQLLKAGGRVTDFECGILNKQGKARRCVTSLRLYPEKGILEGSIEDITERKRVEEALIVSEQQARERAAELQTIMDIVPAIVSIAHDQMCQVVTGNQALYNLVRMPPQSNTSLTAPAGLKPTHFKICLNGIEPPPNKLPLQISAATGVEIRDIEEDIVFDDGRVIHLFGNVVPLFDEQGGARGAVAAFVDITERRQADERIRMLAEIMDTAPSSITVHDFNGKFLYANRRTFDIHRYEAREFMTLNLHELDVPESEALIAPRMKQIVETGEASFEVAHFRKDGSIVPLSIYVKKIDWLGEPAMLSIGTDITERKRAEEQIRRHTEELEVLSKVTAAMRVAEKLTDIYPVLLKQVAVLLKATGTAIALRVAGTGEMVIELGYGAWETWTGLHLDPGQGISSLMTSSRKPYLADDSKNDPTAADQDLIHKITETACVVLSTNRDTIGALWMGSKTKITEGDKRLLNAIGDMAANAIQRQVLFESLQTQLETVRETQARLVQSEKLAAIGQLVSGVAHELNNPLTSVVLYAQLVQQEKLTKKAHDNLDKAVSEALRAGKIVRGLLDFARQRPIDRQAIQVNEILKESLGLIAYELHANNIKVALDLSPELPPIMADPHQLTQVFINLLQNAWQAMSTAHGKGLITITTSIGESSYSIHTSNKSKMVRICFLDNGPGISKDLVNRIFDPFFTTKPEGAGTGLGLSICHGIIAEHDGHIWAESKAGEGAAFFVELPIKKITKAKRIDPAEHKSLASTPKNLQVLILDDEPNVRDVLAQALRRRGYTVDAVGNGEDGLALLSKADYNIVLCDIRMPGFNGVDFYRQVQNKYPDWAKKVVFITGDTANKVTYKFIEENEVKYLSKPFELSDLLQVIQLVEDGA